MPLSSLELVEEIIYGDSLRLLEGSDETQLDTNRSRNISSRLNWA